MAGRSNQITVNEDTSWDRVKAAQASKLMTLAPPYVLWPIVGGIGTALHALFGTPLPKLYRGVLPFLAIYLVMLMLITYVPAITLAPLRLFW